MPTRRTFLKTAGAAVLTASVAPAVLGTQNKSASGKPVLGEGDYRYEVTHNWGEVPKHVQWGATHGVCVDSEGLIYIKHRNRVKDPMDAIVVFDAQGKFVRSFGKVFHAGGHGIDLRKDGNQEFLYVSDTKHGIVAKLTLKGEIVWAMGRPTEPEAYANPKARYSPTNLCFAPDGGFYVGDGYGSSFIHQYDKNRKLVRTWGGRGSEPGKMATPHGMWLDERGDTPTIAVCDRANNRLQFFSLEGKHLGFNHDVSFPADIDIQGDVMLVSDLHARVTLFDKDNKVITHLGYDQSWTDSILETKTVSRTKPETWQDGRFIHPHDACFDADGNIFVTEWVATGRVNFLKRLS